MEERYGAGDELTLRELILAIQDYFRFFLKKWYWFVIACLVAGALSLYVALRAPTVYPAPLTFVINNEKEGGLGAGAILGNLGLGSDKGDNQTLKLLEMAKSRQLLGKVLFDSAVVNDKKELVANHLIELYNFHKEWEDIESRRGFTFENGMPASDNLLENGVYKQLHFLLIREQDGLLVSGVDEVSGVLSIRATTLNPDLSMVITKGVYRQLKEHYVQSLISGKQQTLNQLKLRADSVKNALNVAEARLARFQDRSATITLRSNTTEQSRLQREVFILNTMYAEIVKNRETSAFLLANEKPAFSLIDEPLAPLRKVQDSKVTAVIIGILLGGILAGAILFFTKLIRDAMQPLNS